MALETFEAGYAGSRPPRTGAQWSGMWKLGQVTDRLIDGKWPSAWSVAGGNLTKSFAIAPGETTPLDVQFNDDGTKFYVIGSARDTIFQYTCATAWDVSTSVYANKSFYVGRQEGNPNGLFFKSDGTKFYIVGNANNRIFQYSCSTAWDVNTAVYDSKSFSVSTQETNSTGLFFKPDGTKFYIIGTSADAVFQYSCVTAWDVSTATWDSIGFSVSTQDGNPNGLFFKPDGTTFYIIGSTNDTVYQYSCATAWAVNGASYASKSLVVSIQEGDPRGVFFKSDGTQLYFVGTASRTTVFQYSLSTAWDVSTGSYSQKAFYIGAGQETSPGEVQFNDDGTKFYVIGSANDTVYQYSCATAWDVSTASFANKSFFVGLQETNSTGLFFKPDGTKFYIIGISSDTVYQYSCATAWDVSTASYDSKSFSVSTQDGNPNGLFFKPDGTTFYIIGSTSDTVYQYSCATAWDVSTASYASKSFSVSGQDTIPLGLFFKSDGTILYVLGANNRTVYQYSCATAWDISTASYASKSFSVATQLASDSLAGICFKSDGTKLYILGVNFKIIYQYSCATAWDVSTASYDNKFYRTATEETTPYGLTFKTDGTKFYIVGTTYDTIFQYSCSTAWDISTGSYDNKTFTTTAQEGNPTALFFKPDGTKLYVIGSTNDAVFQYSCATAWDVSTASYDSKSFSANALESAAEGLFFKPDGTKFYIVGSTNDTVFQFACGTAWDISTAYYETKSFTIRAQEATPLGLYFKDDGTKFYILGSTGDTIYQYFCTTPWDVSTASYDGVSYSVATQDTTSHEIQFKPDGTTFYVLGDNTDTIYQYSGLLQ